MKNITFEKICFGALLECEKTSQLTGSILVHILKLE